MSSSRRPAASEDSILASLERGSSERTHRGWLIIGGSAAAVLTLMIAWLAYGNATSVRSLPPSAVKRPVAAPVAPPMLSQSLPPVSIPAPQAAAIIDELALDPPARTALVMLPPDEIAKSDAAMSVAAMPAAKPAPAKVAAAPRQTAKSAKPAAAKPAAAKAAPRKVAARKAKPAAPQAASADVDSDVALLSAILAHSTRHADERAQQEKDACQGKKCPAKPAK